MPRTQGHETDKDDTSTPLEKQVCCFGWLMRQQLRIEQTAQAAMRAGYPCRRVCGILAPVSPEQQTPDADAAACRGVHSKSIMHFADTTYHLGSRRRSCSPILPLAPVFHMCVSAAACCSCGCASSSCRCCPTPPPPPPSSSHTQHCSKSVWRPCARAQSAPWP